MTTTITKGKIGEQDVNHWDGTEDGLTFERDTSTGGTMTLQSVGAVVDVLMSYGGGVNRDRAAIAGALTAIGATNKVGLVLRPGTWDIDDDITITSNIALMPAPGCKFTVAAGKTATIQGPVMAGPYQWIYGTGTTTISTYPQDQIWWGNTQRTDFGSVRWSVGSDANGDIYYRKDGVLTRLAKGGTNSILTMGVQTLPYWDETPYVGLPEIIASETQSLSAWQLKGSIVNNYGQAADAVITLAAAAVGLSFIVILGTTVAKYYRLDPNANDSIYLLGTTTGDGKYVGIASAVKGAAISFTSFRSGAATYDWYATPISGTWVAEA